MPYTDIEALAQIENILAQLVDEKSKQMVSSWLFQKYGGIASQTTTAPTIRKPTKSNTSNTGAQGKKRKSSRKPVIVSALNLRPEGKQTFIDFAKEKSPSNHGERGTVAIFYLTRILGLDKAGRNHIHTCFVEAGWRLPSDLDNALQVSASKYSWLDTSSMDDIRLTARGENLVKLDLPKRSE